MNSFEVSTNNTIVLQKDIFRLAAAIYSENNDAVYESEIQEQIIECMFTSTGNEYFTISEIISSVLEIYKYHISEEEVEKIIKKTRGKFQQVTKDGCKAYSLTKQAYDEAETLQKNNIDSYIDLFIKERNINDPEKCKNAIHVYLYELTTTNINSYRVLLEGKDGTQFTSDELSVDVSDLNDIEKSLVHDFLSWNNPEKNAALGNLVFCCLEYCLLINGDTPNNLLKRYIKTRDIYLDTNIIFRALGINGESRKKVILAFIKKCKQASIKLYITHNTRKEFFDTINYYVNQMQHLKKGTIFPGAYDQITDYNIFSFYEEWYRNHANTSLKYFITYINSQYMEFVKEFCIEDDAMIPASIYNSSIFKAERNNYSASIKNVKQKINDDYTPEDYRYTQRDSHDATVVRYIELLRIKTNAKDIFLVSSDKALRLWDMNRTNSIYPVVIYPSQLFLILLKTCGRSENDYDCFVNFINIRPTSKQVSPENAHAIISGISSITEDIKTQKYLVASVFGEEFQNVIRNSSSDIELYEKVQTITQNYLEEQLKEKENVIKTLQDDIAHRIDSHIYGVDEFPYENMEIDAGEIDWEKFRMGKYVIVSSPVESGNGKKDAKYAFYQIGEKAKVIFPDGTEDEYEVMAIGDIPYAMGPEHSHGLDVYFTLPMDEYMKHVPDSRGAMKLFFNADEVKLEAVDDEVREYCEITQPQLGYSSRMTYLDDFNEMVRMFLLVGGALSFVLALIGVMNFINLTITSINERRTELGTLRAIGMTGKQMAHMLRKEGVFRIGLTFAFVLTAGMLLNHILVNLIAGQMMMFSYKFVIWPVLACIPIFTVISISVPGIAIRHSLSSTC